MKKVNQTKYSLFYSDGKRMTYGNCLIACFASILELPIEEVPNVYVFYGLDKNKTLKPGEHQWFKIIDLWLNMKYNKTLKYKGLNEIPTEEFVIVRGLSTRKKPHCCVYQKVNNKLVPYFDPHPTSEFLSEEHHYYTILDL